MNKYILIFHPSKNSKSIRIHDQDVELYAQFFCSKLSPPHPHFSEPLHVSVRNMPDDRKKPIIILEEAAFLDQEADFLDQEAFERVMNRVMAIKRLMGILERKLSTYRIRLKFNSHHAFLQQLD